MNAHKRACLVVPVMGPLRKAVTETAASTHRNGGRVEEDAHLTIRYGIRNENPDTLRTLRNILKDTPSFAVQFGELMTFDASESSEGLYPLVIRCEQVAGLTTLFKQVSKHINCDKFTFDTYKPHITLAYLPNKQIPVITTEAARGLCGMSFPVYRADLYWRNGNRSVFPVGNPSARWDAPYSSSTAPNPGRGPMPVGESTANALQGVKERFSRARSPLPTSLPSRKR